MRLACSVSTTCLRASSACVCSFSLSISSICLSSFAISLFRQRVAALLVLDLRRRGRRAPAPTTATPRIASADRQRDELPLARLPLLLAVRQQVDADHVSRSSAARARRRSSATARPAQLPRPDRSDDAACWRTDWRRPCGTPARLATSSSSPGSSGAAAREHDLVDLVVRRRGEEELQRAGALPARAFP